MESFDKQPQEIKQADLKRLLSIGIAEAFSALDESFSGLSDEQFWAYPLENRYNIVTLVEHCLQCLDLYCCEVQGQPLTFEPDVRFDVFHHSPSDLRRVKGDLPTVEAEKVRLTAVRNAAMNILQETSPEKLLQPNQSSWWFQENMGKVRSDAFGRAIFHTMTHVREIWFMRGRLGVSGQQGWPQQHWA
jgi:hypothetical protein